MKLVQAIHGLGFIQYPIYFLVLSYLNAGLHRCYFILQLLMYFICLNLLSSFSKMWTKLSFDSIRIHPLNPMMNYFLSIILDYWSCLCFELQNFHLFSTHLIAHSFLDMFHFRILEVSKILYFKYHFLTDDH